jgi:hypothetical protein
LQNNKPGEFNISKYIPSSPLYEYKTRIRRKHLFGVKNKYETCERATSIKRLEFAKSQAICSYCDKKKIINLIKKESQCHNSIDLLYFVYYFARNFDRNTIEKLLQIDKNRLNKLYLGILQIIFEKIGAGGMVGGKDEVVEIDETFIGKIKYNRGRLHSQKIIFGGISRITKKIFMKVIPKRKKPTLKHAIESFIVPNSTVYTDTWSSYMSFSMIMPSFVMAQ